MATVSPQYDELTEQPTPKQSQHSRWSFDRMADRKSFITTLSGGAFAAGVVGATIYGLRKARLQAIKEAQELAAVGVIASTSRSVSQVASTSKLPAAETPSVLRRKRQHGTHIEQQQDAAPQHGAFALFKQMNTALITPASSIHALAPAVNAPRSVFDDGDTTNTSLPGVLRRRQESTTNTHTVTPITALQSGKGAQGGVTAMDSTQIDYSEMDSTLDFLGLATPIPKDEQARMQHFESEGQAPPTSFAQSPVGLSISAFLIATGIVGLSAFAAVETTKRVLGVDAMDDFVVAMSRLVPGRREVGQRLGEVAPHLRTTYDVDNELDTPVSRPKSVEEALDDLNNAVSFQDWLQKLKTQLDAEREEELRRRFAGYKKEHSQPSSTTSLAYPVYSALEGSEGSNNHARRDVPVLMGISPVLPLSAFGVGMVSGLLTAGKRAGLVFMAENAHRLPDTVQGWYFYSKTKNYKVMLGAIKGGLKQGTRLSLWVTAFCFVERGSEVARTALLREFSSNRDRAVKVVGHWADGALAGLGTASVAAVLYRLPKPAVMRVFQLGLAAGAFTGAVRDAQEHLLHKEIGGIARNT